MKNFLISIFLIAYISLSAQSPIRIVCMGNSITNGRIDVSTKTITQLSYRPCLWEKLDSAGINVDMVGYTNLFFDETASIMAPTPISRFTDRVFDRDHDSYYGIKSDALLNGSPNTYWTGSALPKLSDRLKTYTPDIALLHIGTNDAQTTADVNNTVSNIETIIDELRKSNPNVVIFVAKLITTWSMINGKVDLIVTHKSTLSSPVIAVDLATGFINNIADPNTMTYDWVHPNPKGQQFMADRWYKAIIKQLNTTVKIDYTEEVFLDFETMKVDWSTGVGAYAWSGAVYSIVANPYVDTKNSSSKSFSWTRDTSDGNAGGGYGILFSTNKNTTSWDRFSFQVYSTSPVITIGTTFRLGNTVQGVKTVACSIPANQWTKISLNLSDINMVGKLFSEIKLQIAAGSTIKLMTTYTDNFKFEKELLASEPNTKMTEKTKIYIQTGDVIVDLTGIREATTITVFDVKGIVVKTIKSIGNEKLNISIQNKGIYFVRVQNTTIFTRKIKL